MSALADAWESGEFLELIELSGSCWVFTGPLNWCGYGQIERNIDGVRIRKRAHRVFYEAIVGLVPDGLVLDHLCENKPCVNPAHLEPVTGGENIRRHFAKNVTHCPRRHEYTPENARINRGGRVCRTCHRERERWRNRRAA
jgi:hypothetical protein